MQRFFRRSLHFIVPHFLALAKRKFRIFTIFFKIILKGRRKRRNKWPNIFQRASKTGSKSFPADTDHNKQPRNSPAVYPNRRSASQTAKLRYNQAQKVPTTKIRSARWRCLRRRGRRKPYRIPRPAPNRQAMANRRSASVGAIIRTAGARSRRRPGVLRRTKRRSSHPR